MKTKVRYMDSDGLYMIRSFASGNTLYFEDQEDHQLFFTLFNRFLSPMLEVIEYSLVPTGWVMIVKTKSEKEIKEHYSKIRSKSKKANPKYTKTEIGPMISEHIRYMNSNYVKQSNFNKNRHGSKVHSSFQKLLLEDDQDFIEEIEAMRNLRMFCEQVEERYQADCQYYDDRGMKGKSRWKTGAGRVKLGQQVVGSYIGDLDIYVARKLISSTWNRHFPFNRNKNPPPDY